MKLTTKIAGISSLILLSIFLLTDPQELPSVLLIVPFVLLFAVLFSSAVFVLGYLTAGTRATRVRIGLIIASVPVLLLVLQSLGQLTVRDTLAIFVLFGITYFYMSRLRVSSAS